MKGRVTIADIEQAACIGFRISKRDIREGNNARRFARPRQIVMFLAKEVLHRSYPQIGEYFGRDHTTALYAVRRIRALSATDDRLARQILAVTELMEKSRPRMSVRTSL